MNSFTVIFEDEQGNARHGLYDNYNQLNEVINRTGWKVKEIRAAA